MSLSRLILAARGASGPGAPSTGRAALVERAMRIPGCPDWLSEYHVENHLERDRKFVPNGDALRYLAAAAGVPLAECFQAMRYWPPVGNSEVEIAALVRGLGGKIIRSGGGRLLIELPVGSAR